MPRIIAGVAGGRPLTVPDGRTIRPTADRVKEALFSALDADPGLSGRRVLDLYAGSGALGLEAVSRGAEAATLVESNAAVLRVLRANVKSLGLPGVTVMPAEAVGWLRTAEPTAFDVVLVDPPYSDDVTAVLAALVDRPWLTTDAVVVVERATRDSVVPWPAGLVEARARRYGDVTLCYGRRP